MDQEARLDGYCRAVLACRCSNSCLYIAGEEQASQKTLSSAFQSDFNYGFPYYFVRWVGRIAEVNGYSAISPIKITVSACGNHIVFIPLFCMSLRLKGFLKIIMLPSTAKGGLLSRLAFKALTYLILSICTGSSQELHSAPPEQQNAEGQCLVGRKSCEQSSGGLRAKLWLIPNFSNLHNAKSNKTFMGSLSHFQII